MDSLTKRQLDLDQIRAAVARAFGAQARVLSVDELPEGMFNAVYRVYLDGTEPGVVILKSSPPTHVPLLTYEHDIMRTEAAFYQLASTSVPVPQVLATDFSRTTIDGDLLFISYLEGEGWHRMHEKLDAEDEARLRRNLGAMVARLHRITGSEFGYFQHGAAQGSTWREAFSRMVDDVLTDASRFKVPLAIDAQAVRDTIASKAAILDAVTVPTLVHFDLWEGNIFLAERSSRFELAGFIDGERAMWADPLAEFASIQLFGNIADDSDFLAGYGSLAITPDVEVRLAMYKAYLDLIMIIEAGPRGYQSEEHAETLALAYDDLRRSIDRITAQR